MSDDSQTPAGARMAWKSSELPSPASIRKALKTLADSERQNQIYYLLGGVAGLSAGVGIIVWFLIAHLPSMVVGAAIPWIGSAFSVTQIVGCETRRAQYQAAAALDAANIVMAVDLLKATLLPRGAKK